MVEPCPSPLTLESCSHLIEQLLPSFPFIIGPPLILERVKVSLGGKLTLIPIPIDSFSAARCVWCCCAQASFSGIFPWGSYSLSFPVFFLNPKPWISISTFHMNVWEFRDTAQDCPGRRQWIWYHLPTSAEGAVDGSALS